MVMTHVDLIEKLLRCLLSSPIFQHSNFSDTIPPRKTSTRLLNRDLEMPCPDDAFMALAFRLMALVTGVCPDGRHSPSDYFEAVRI